MGLGYWEVTGPVQMETINLPRLGNLWVTGEFSAEVD